MSKEEILECNFNPTHTKKHANSYKNIRPNISYPRTTPLPSEKKTPFRDSPKQHSHFVHHFPLNRNKYLRYSISDTTNQSSQLSRSKLNINSCRFLCWPSVKGRGDGRQKHLGHAMAGALKEPSLSLACSSNL